ncbi:MAG: hypothetical protein NW900_02390, partial [Candidatus Blochmannia sp. A2]|nr:hypothetical protein [Candidatus Blochmannia sp. A2]
RVEQREKVGPTTIKRGAYWEATQFLFLFFIYFYFYFLFFYFIIIIIIIIIFSFFLSFCFVGNKEKP